MDHSLHLVYKSLVIAYKKSVSDILALLVTFIFSRKAISLQLKKSAPVQIQKL